MNGDIPVAKMVRELWHIQSRGDWISRRRGVSSGAPEDCLQVLASGEESTGTETRKHVTENVVYEGLKHYRGISQTKRHKHILEVTNWCVEGCLPLIFLSDSDKVVGVAEVLFSEDFVHDRGFGRRDRLEGEDTCSCGCSLVMFFSPW